MDLDALQELGEHPRPHLRAAPGALGKLGQLYFVFHRFLLALQYFKFLYFRFGFLLIPNNLIKSSNSEVSVGSNMIHFPS